MFRVEIIYPGNKKYSSKYPHGLSLYANGKSVEFFTKDKAQFALWISHLRNHCIMTNFNNNYNVADLLGTGGYGKVHLVENLVNGNKYAGKFIRLSPAINKERQKTMIVNEIKILRKLEHGQIVKLFEVYEMPSQICLVMEFIEGEKLFNYITKNKMLSEKTTAYIMKQLLLILNYLEGQDIIHRDIKPENILYTYNIPDKPILKVIDFGLATFHKRRDMVRKCGTAGYVAPEILNNQPYNFKVDLYSVGIIMYICLTGRPVFYGKDYDELLARNKRGTAHLKGSAWEKLSPSAQDLIKKILNPVPSLRISLSEALNHEWLFKNIPAEDRKDLSEYIFRAVKLNVPEEDNIAHIPITSGQLPYINKVYAISLPEMSVSQKPYSHSFVTSNLAAGVEDNRELNSFYKKNSKDVSFVSSMNSHSASASHNSSGRERSAGRNLTFEKSNSLYTKKSTLGLPSSPKRGYLRPQSLQPTEEGGILRRIHGEKGYNIKVRAADTSEEEKVGSQDEGSFCSMKYEELEANKYRFPVVKRGVSPSRFSEKGQNVENPIFSLRQEVFSKYDSDPEVSPLTRRRVAPSKLSTKQSTYTYKTPTLQIMQPESVLRFEKYDADSDTPRVKGKVGAISQEVRNQLEFGDQDEEGGQGGDDEA